MCLQLQKMSRFQNIHVLQLHWPYLGYLFLRKNTVWITEYTFASATDTPQCITCVFIANVKLKYSSTLMWISNMLCRLHISNHFLAFEYRKEFQRIAQ